jgi:MarR family transcriptional regulator, negative regulator of the multidrug operon emrRAB
MATSDVEETAAGHGSAAPAALVALHEFLGGASIDQLRQVVGLTPSGAVRLIDRLSESGLVKRGPGPDGRSRAVTLTRRGSDAARRVLAARRAVTETLLAGLSTSERERLTPLPERLLHALTAARLGERASSKTPPGGWLCSLCDFSACGRDKGACPVTNLSELAVERQLEGPRPPRRRHAIDLPRYDTVGISHDTRFSGADRLERRCLAAMVGKAPFGLGGCLAGSRQEGHNAPNLAHLRPGPRGSPLLRLGRRAARPPR